MLVTERSISWEPLDPGGGANFHTLTLSSCGPHQIRVVATPSFKIFCSIFSGLGLLALLLSVGIPTCGSVAPKFFGAMAGTLVLFVGLGLMQNAKAERVFDRRTGELTWEKRSLFGESELIQREQLKNIVALQLLPKYTEDSDGVCNSFELNMVFQNGRRLQVLQHGSLTKINKEGQQLADFLKIPLWRQVY